MVLLFSGSKFLSVATGRLQRTIVYLPPAIHVCQFVVCQSGTNKNLNFSAVCRLIGLKLSGDLGLVSQISVHVLVSRFDYSLYCKQTKET
jgi:hypothetical protein